MGITYDSELIQMSILNGFYFMKLYLNTTDLQKYIV